VEARKSFFDSTLHTASGHISYLICSYFTILLVKIVKEWRVWRVWRVNRRFIKRKIVKVSYRSSNRGV